MLEMCICLTSDVETADIARMMQQYGYNWWLWDVGTDE